MFDAAAIARLERSAAAQAELSALALPAPAASVASFGDGVLVAMGPGRYVNRAVGITLRDLTDHDLDEVEAFFAEASVPAAVELSSLAPASTVTQLSQRGYRLDWFRSVFATPPTSGDTSPTSLRVREVTDSDVAEWLDVLATGNGAIVAEQRAVSDEFAIANRTVRHTTNYLAFDGDVAVGCGSVQVVDGVAWLGGAATLPQHRSRGVQLALLQARMQAAAGSGATLIAASALTNGASARNLQRAGLHHVFTQAVVSRP